MGIDGGSKQVAVSKSWQCADAAHGAMLAFVSSLIEQNAKLAHELQQSASQTKLADEILAEAHQKTEAISSLIKKEVNDRAACIVSESENKAKEEVARIVAEALANLEAIKALKEKEANGIAGRIIRESAVKARLEADRILTEAKEQAHSLFEEETKKAQQYELLIIDKARDKAISILDEANAELLAFTNKSGRKSRR